MVFKEIKTFGQEFKSNLRNYINFKNSTNSDDPFNKNESIGSEKSTKGRTSIASRKSKFYSSTPR